MTWLHNVTSWSKINLHKRYEPTTTELYEVHTVRHILGGGARMHAESKTSISMQAMQCVTGIKPVYAVVCVRAYV